MNPKANEFGEKDLVSRKYDQWSIYKRGDQDYVVVPEKETVKVRGFSSFGEALDYAMDQEGK